MLGALLNGAAPVVEDLIFTVLTLDAYFLERGLNRSHLVQLRLLVLLLTLTTARRRRQRLWLTLAVTVTCLALLLARLRRLSRILVVFLASTVVANQMLWLSVHVVHRLGLVTPVALHAAFEVVVLTLAADPAAVREIEVLLL